MTESPKAEPTSGPSSAPRKRARALLVWVPAIALVAFAAASSAGMFAEDPSDAAAPAPVELGGVDWRSVDIKPSTTGDGFTIQAKVADTRLEGDSADRRSPYVLWMLANGRFDDRPWTDSWLDEDALGMSHDAQVTIVPTGDGDHRRNLISTGTYTPSIDGEITYDRIPAGEYTLRALVLREGGFWDGTIAMRRIVVE
jgi:hypothetical protein